MSQLNLMTLAPMYQYLWDEETGGLLLTTEQSKFSKEPRPVYATELSILGFDQYWSYPKDDRAPLMWAEANNYIYRGRLVARTKGGALYTAPKLIIIEEPEPKDELLRFVNIEKMVRKNWAVMETLAQETIQKIYNTYISYKSKVDLFYVAFSGGKDSIVALDLVQKSLPHNDFKVLFGNTDMEFPTTLALVKGVRQSVKGVNRYLSVGVDAEWVRYYLEDQSYEPGNRKTDTMFSFLDDAGITKKRKLTSFGEKVIEMGINNEFTWALMLCNLVDAAPFRWYIENIPFDLFYEAAQLDLDMEDASKKARGEFWNGFKVILDSNELLQQIGFGRPDITSKTNKNGDVKKTMNYLQRVTWENPDARVILYSLYKFAEKCGGYYQFSLSTLLDDSIERDGISPTRIFGLNYDTMVPILNGLSVNYPDFISATFSLGLDTISLREDKSAQDVLGIF